ncbi:MAG: ABC transporter ATP-binding protein [Phycisphaerales bacterium]|jgi:multiple sugar transport system ATP-binding protein|nr:ABC transporter ATP-binding protein [Phycisphaerales bacterium]
MAEVSLSNVTKTYAPEIRAVRNIDLTIADGEFVVLVGPSGCGKSTTLRMIAGIEDVTSGSICIGNTNVTNLPARKRNIAMVFQDYALYPHMSVAQNLAFGLERRREYSSSCKALLGGTYRKQKTIESADIRKRVQEAAVLLGLTNELERKPKALSGGQRQRVALGRAIVRDPEVFLLDEPLSNLDAKLRRAMRIELRALHKRLGVTMVHVTHDQEEAMTLGDKLAVMDDGIIRQFDTPANIYDCPADRFVASFVGIPEMNFVEGELHGTRFDSQDLSLDVPKERLPKTNARSVVLGVRPENISIHKGSSALVTNEERHGDHTDVFVEVGTTSLAARVHGTFKRTDRVDTSIDPSKVHFFETGKSGKRLLV